MKEDGMLEWLESTKLLGIKVINVGDFTELMIRLILNLILIFVVVYWLYAKTSRRKDFFFSYIAVATVTFLLCYLLNNVKLELGFALGLFAIFGIIRYRTSTIPIKEMTYLFVVIGISVINALSNKKVSYAELVLANATIILILWWLEHQFLSNSERSMILVYEKINNIHISQKEVFLSDLKARTGMDITHFEIQKINFLRDSAEVLVFYNEE